MITDKVIALPVRENIHDLLNLDESMIESRERQLNNIAKTREKQTRHSCQMRENYVGEGC